MNVYTNSQRATQNNCMQNRLLSGCRDKKTCVYKTTLRKLRNDFSRFHHCYCVEVITVQSLVHPNCPQIGTPWNCNGEDDDENTTTKQNTPRKHEKENRGL